MNMSRCRHLFEVNSWPALPGCCSSLLERAASLLSSTVSELESASTLKTLPFLCIINKRRPFYCLKESALVRYGKILSNKHNLFLYSSTIFSLQYRLRQNEVSITLYLLLVCRQTTIVHCCASFRFLINCSLIVVELGQVCCLCFLQRPLF